MNLLSLFFFFFFQNIHLEHGLSCLYVNQLANLLLTSNSPVDSLKGGRSYRDKSQDERFPRRNLSQ